MPPPSTSEEAIAGTRRVIQRSRNAAGFIFIRLSETSRALVTEEVGMRPTLVTRTRLELEFAMTVPLSWRRECGSHRTSREPRRTSQGGLPGGLRGASHPVGPRRPGGAGIDTPSTTLLAHELRVDRRCRFNVMAVTADRSPERTPRSSRSRLPRHCRARGVDVLGCRGIPPSSVPPVTEPGALSSQPGTRQ